MKITFNPETHQYFDREGKELPSVTFLLQNFGLINLDGINPFVLNRGGAFGKEVHRATALHDLNNLGDLKWQHPDFKPIIPYLNGWKKYENDYGIKKWDLIEKPLGSEIWRFAGTPDRYLKSGGILIDEKTGVDQPATDIQLAGYEILILENIKGARVRERLTIKLFPDNYKIIQHKEKIDGSLIKSAAQLYNWKKQKGLIKP